MSEIFITVSNPGFYQSLVKEPSLFQSNWTITSKARPGDRVLLYITAPISAIVASATISTEPEKDDEPQSPWRGHYISDIEDILIFIRPITRDDLRRCFGRWGYWKQPRNSVRVPQQYRDKMYALIRIAKGEAWGDYLHNLDSLHIALLTALMDASGFADDIDNGYCKVCGGHRLGDTLGTLKECPDKECRSNIWRRAIEMAREKE